MVPTGDSLLHSVPLRIKMYSAEYSASMVLRAYPPPCHARPVPRGSPVGLTCGHVTGFPVLRLSSSSTHAVTNTPAESQAALSVLFTCDGGLPRINAGSASALPFSRPAQCSLTLRPACSPSPFTEPSTPEASAASLPCDLKVA